MGFQHVYMALAARYSKNLSVVLCSPEELKIAASGSGLLACAPEFSGGINRQFPLRCVLNTCQSST
jgi:hypothetical protein